MSKAIGSSVNTFFRSGFLLLALGLQLFSEGHAQAGVLGGEAPCPWCQCEDETRCPYLYVWPGGALSRTEGNLQERHRVSRLKSADGTILDFSLIYNTYDADSSRGARVNTVLGYGWTHSYNLFLFFQGEFLFRMDGTGRVTRYQRAPDGTYLATEGYFETIVRNPDLSFTLTRKDQTVFTFREISGTSFPDFLGGATVYRVTSIADRTHATTAFTYDSGNLTSITDQYGRSVTLTSNSQHQVTSVTDPLGRATNFTYDGTGLELTTITDPRGLSTHYDYNSEYQVTHKTDSEGRAFFYDYTDSKPTAVRDADGDTLVSLTNFERWAIDPIALMSEYLHLYVPCATGESDGRGNVWTYQYDVHGYLIQTITPDAVSTLYTYDDATLMESSVTDGNGRTTRYDYDALGNRTRITDAAGQVTTMTYEPTFNRVTSITEPTGRLYTYSYDGIGNLVSFTDPLNNVWSYTYFASTDLVDSETDPRGVVTRNEYDGFGNRTATIEAYGTPEEATIHTHYDSIGNLLSVTDPNGNTRSYEYDEVGNQISTTSPLGRITRTAYDMYGDVISVTDPVGQVTQNHYDGLNRLVQTVEPGGRSTTRSYDLNSNLLTVTDEDGRATQQSYDVQNRVTEITDPTGRTTQYSYDFDGNVILERDGRGLSTSMGYDALNRQTSVTDPAGSSRSVDLDPYGNPLTVHDARGFTYSQTYDDRDLLTSLRDPLGNTTSFTYGSIPRLDTKTSALGNTTRYEYDLRERPTRVDYSDGTETDFTFDPGGRVTRIATPQSDFSYGYDADDELTVVTNGLTGETIQYNYNPRGQRSVMTDPDGVVTRYDYDERALLTNINRNGRDEARYTYDPAGQLIQRVDGSGTVTEYHYTGPDHLDLIHAHKSDGSTLYRQSFERDGNYNVTRMEQELTLPNGSHQTNILHHLYDDVDRLVHEERRAADDVTILSRTDYDYDPSGNRTRRVQDGVTTTYDYNSGNQLLRETTGSRVITYAYDPNGNLLTETVDGMTLAYSYDHENRVIAISCPSVTASYVLAADGTRLAKTVNGTMTTYVYDGLNVITESRTGQTTKYLFGPNPDENLLTEGNSGRFYYHRGNVNSVLGLSDANQNVVNTYDYAAFGEPLSASEGTYNPYRFTGRQLESESEHYYFRERLYASRVGRFLSVEPSRADAERSLSFGRTPRAPKFEPTPGPLSFGRTPRSLEFGRTPRILGETSRYLLYDAPLPISLERKDVEPYVYLGNNPTNRVAPTGETPAVNPPTTAASIVTTMPRQLQW